MQPTCPGTQEKSKDGLLSKVLNGQVSLFSSYRTIHTLIAVAFTQREKREKLKPFSITHCGVKHCSKPNTNFVSLIYSHAPTVSYLPLILNNILNHVFLCNIPTPQIILHRPIWTVKSKSLD